MTDTPHIVDIIQEHLLTLDPGTYRLGDIVDGLHAKHGHTLTRQQINTALHGLKGVRLEGRLDNSRKGEWTIHAEKPETPERPIGVTDIPLGTTLALRIVGKRLSDHDSRPIYTAAEVGNGALYEVRRTSPDAGFDSVDTTKRHIADLLREALQEMSPEQRILLFTDYKGAKQ